MNKENELFAFETKYPFLYEITVGGVPVYTCLRDSVLLRLREGAERKENGHLQAEQGKIFFRRILGGFFKLKRFRKKKSLVFTSSVYRRDNGRNLAFEYLLDKYPDAVAFEWPSRNTVYDKAYFKDENKARYCPLDYYVLRYKLFCILHKKKFAKRRTQVREELMARFSDVEITLPNEQVAIDYIIQELPNTFVATESSQMLFRKLFKKYKNLEYAVDFWGAGRENIIPVLKGNPVSVELQHGIITAVHPGYIYPKFVKDSGLAFFKRKLLVYGEGTKEILVKQSIFDEEQVEVIGNPRIQRYRQIYQLKSCERKLILFASQSYEQDGTGRDYYKTVIDILKAVKAEMDRDSFWEEYRLGVKLHPRENDRAKEVYQAEIPGIEVYGNASQLFEILNRTFVQLTVSSTTLYEATLFNTPTVAVGYKDYNPMGIYGFETWFIKDADAVAEMMQRLKEKPKYDTYLDYLKTKTEEYM